MLRPAGEFHSRFFLFFFSPSRKEFEVMNVIKFSIFCLKLRKITIFFKLSPTYFFKRISFSL